MNVETKKLELKLDKIEERLSSIDVTLTKQASQLEHHIYRTDLAEKHLSMLEQELKPVKRHVAMIDGILKGLGVLSTIVAIAAGIAKVLEYV